MNRISILLLAGLVAHVKLFIMNTLLYLSIVPGGYLLFYLDIVDNILFEAFLIMFHSVDEITSS